MTDKELRKLSRLELLELLLTESRENDKLKEELSQLKKENSIDKTTVLISDTAKQIEEILNTAKSLTENLNGIFSDNQVIITPKSPVTQTKEKKKKSKDAKIYERLLLFFYRNPDALTVLSEELHTDIQNRIDEIVSTQN